MQVCHITSVHPRYDIRIFVKECKSIAEEHNLSLIVADSKGDELKDGINIYDVGKVNGKLKRILTVPKRIFIKVLELKPEVVHFHDPELIGIAYKLAKLGFKVIYDSHEDVPTQVLEKHWIPKLIRPLIAKLVDKKEAATLPNFAGVICATDKIASRLGKYNSNTITVFNYPKLAEFQMKEVNWDTRRDSMCYVGSISEVRGIIDLIDSLNISKCHLDLAGLLSYPEMSDKMQASAGFEHVTYHGVLNRQEVCNLLSQVKIGFTVLPKTPPSYESLPTKLFEFMMAGIPVICSDFPILKPIVEGNNCGLMIRPSDPKLIAEATLWLMNNPDEAKRMGERGREAALKYYNWEAEIPKLLQFYNRLK